MDRRFPAVLALALLVTLSGCATVTVDSDVAADGTIDRYELDLTTSTTVYGLLNDAAVDDGYDSLAQQLRANVNVSNAANVSVDESLDGENASVTLVVTEWDPVDNDRLNVTRTDGTVVYTDTTFYNASVADGAAGGISLADFRLRYTVNMPGDIQRAEGADSVNGSTATYESRGQDAYTSTRVEVESDAPTGVLSPGFGIAPAVVAAVVASLAGAVLARRRSA